MTRLESEQRWLTCTRCDLHKTRTRVVTGYGNPKADIMFVAEAPGGEEDVNGIPLIGPAGELFWALLDAVGMSATEVFVNNVLGCRPYVMDGNTKKDRPPKRPEIAACLPRLRAAIYTVDPILIVTMGNTAFHALTGDKTMVGAARGGMYEAEIPGERITVRYPVLPTFHPSFLNRKRGDRKKPNSVWEQTIRDMVRAVEMYDKARLAYYGIEIPIRK